MSERTYVYTKHPVNSDRLEIEITKEGFTPELLEIRTRTQPEDNLGIRFSDELSPEEKSTLDTVVANHNGQPPPDFGDRWRGRYTGNGTEQTIYIYHDWKQLTIIRRDRKFIIYYFRSDDGVTIGQVAVGENETYRRFIVAEGGISNGDGNNFNVGDHISVNQEGHVYFWKVE